MADRPQTILLCSCEDTMPLDSDAVRRGCRNAKIETANQLCRAELGRFRAALAEGAPLTVACTQEAPLFADAAQEVMTEGTAQPSLTFVNVRETAGWSSQAHAAGPKMAAMLAAAAVPAPEVPVVTLSSDGVIMVYGRDDQAIEAAHLLKDHLDVTVMITGPEGLAPDRRIDFPVVKGTVRAAKGHLGAFEIVVDDFAAPAPSSRAALAFGPGRDGAVSHCDVILDMSGKAPLFQRSSGPGISSAASTSRAISRSARRFAHIRDQASSAAAAVWICARPAPSRPPAITSRSTPISAPGVVNAPRRVRPARPPTRCRPPMR
jgi:hypothetical protein